MRGLLILALGLVLAAGCDQIEATVRGPQAARWSLPADEAVGPETTEFTALVTEVDCASGQSSEGRIVGPEIEFTPDAVIIEFRVRPLGGAQACPGNPPTPVRVQLGQPLGDRRLLDGSVDPPVEPGVCGGDFCG